MSLSKIKTISRLTFPHLSTKVYVRKPWRDIFTYYLLLTTYYLSLITYYLLLITYYLLLITYYLLLIISFITPITAGNSKYTFPVTAVAVVVVVVVVVAVYL